MENIFGYLRVLFAEDENNDENSTENTTETVQISDPVVYEEINEMMDKNEIEIVGVE